jgi:hypothetical protein
MSYFAASHSRPDPQREGEQLLAKHKKQKPQWKKPVHGPLKKPCPKLKKW